MNVERVIAAAKSCAISRWVQCELDNLQWFQGYATDGFPDCPNGLIAANWNEQHGDNTMRRLGDILERMGVELDWSDCVIGCDQCYKAINTQPQTMCDYPHYFLGDGFVVCENCVKAGHDLERYCDETAESGRLDRFNVEPPAETWIFLGELDSHSYHETSYRGRNTIPDSVGLGCRDMLADDNGNLWLRRSAIPSAVRQWRKIQDRLK